MQVFLIHGDMVTKFDMCLPYGGGMFPSPFGYDRHVPGPSGRATYLFDSVYVTSYAGSYYVG